jgi:hypothetical protein
MNVSQIQQEVSDILEESIMEERARESMTEKPQAKLKKLLSSPAKIGGATTTNIQTVL